MSASVTNAAKPQILAERFKTKMCKNFEEQGSCPYETRCMFAHGDHEMRTKQMNLNDNLVTEEAIKAFQKSKALADKASPKKKSGKSTTPTASSKAAAKAPSSAVPSVKPVAGSSVSASKTAALRSFVEVCAAGATAKDDEASGSLTSLSASSNMPLAAEAQKATDDAPATTTSTAMPPATMSVGSLSDDCSSSSYRDPTPGASPSRPATPQAPTSAIAGEHGNQRRHDSAATTPSKRWRHDPYAAAATVTSWCDTDEWMEQEDAMMQHAAYYHPSSFAFDHPHLSEAEIHGVADSQQRFAPMADGLSTYGRQRRFGNSRRAILGVA